MDIAQKIINLRVPASFKLVLDFRFCSFSCETARRLCSFFNKTNLRIHSFFNKTNLRIHSFLLTMVHGKNKIPVGGIELC